MYLLICVEPVSRTILIWRPLLNTHDGTAKNRLTSHMMRSASFGLILSRRRRNEEV